MDAAVRLIAAWNGPDSHRVTLDAWLERGIVRPGMLLAIPLNSQVSITAVVDELVDQGGGRLSIIMGCEDDQHLVDLLVQLLAPDELLSLREAGTSEL